MFTRDLFGGIFKAMEFRFHCLFYQLTDKI
nr:MAG TPA: hypothetical protein [Caudoviricetes sp.]DAJ58540.1 MAG TPA: hypothetical protein [Caudoviricetes sp.]DAM07225.1 MAG TPA: hypothetical protein [Caudoviricetes sp.]